MKGLVFAGCSFTWGQGLYYYSKLETLKEPPPNQYDANLLTDAHKRYMATLRYPRLVANYFKTFEVVSYQNSGSEHNSFRFLDQVFGQTTDRPYLMNEKFNFNEIEYIVIQTSQPNRNLYTYTRNNIEYEYGANNPETKSNFYEWLIEEKKWTFEMWYDDHLKNLILEVKNMMIFYESKGIKTLILCWEDDYISLINEDKWMLDRFVPLYYKEKYYNTIRHLMTENKYLTINGDFDHFETPPQDHHPSLECHEIIANSIITKIENQIKNNYTIQTKELRSNIIDSNLNFVYDNWDDEKNEPIRSNSEEIYDYRFTLDGMIIPIIDDNYNRYKISDIIKYPDKNFFYTVTRMPDEIKFEISKTGLPILPIAIEYLKLYKNFNVLFINTIESESYDTFVSIHNWAKKLELNISQLWIINNNPKLKDYKATLNSNINVYSSNFMAKSSAKEAKDVYLNVEFNIVKENLFLCHNRKLKTHRHGILVLLKKYNLLDDTDWSLINGWQYDKTLTSNFYSSIFNNNDMTDLAEEIEFFNNIELKKSKYEEYFDSFNKEYVNEYVSWVSSHEKKTYENSYFNICTETYFCTETIHITEKSYKAFASFQFPIMIASPYHIKEMKKKYDFDFFDDVINHDYDAITNHRDRMFRIIKELNRIHDNKEFFIDFYKKNKDRFMANQNKILNLYDDNQDKKYLMNINNLANNIKENSNNNNDNRRII